MIRPVSSEGAAVPRRRFSDVVAIAVATGLGSGYSPVAPGTVGAALGLLLFWPLAAQPFVLQAAATLALSGIGVAAASSVARRTGLHDPGLVVVDEIAGMWVALWLLPFTPWTVAFAFVLFRVMDVLKPWPARELEALPGGWGIVADDLMAGVYANLLVRVALKALAA
jgi:phosphatidylglycerophosphatase A